MTNAKPTTRKVYGSFGRLPTGSHHRITCGAGASVVRSPNIYIHSEAPSGMHTEAAFYTMSLYT